MRRNNELRIANVEIGCSHRVMNVVVHGCRNQSGSVHSIFAIGNSPCRIRTLNILSFIFSLSIVMGTVTTSAFAQQSQIIVADKYVAPDGSLRAGAALVIAGGKIKTLRRADLYEDDPTVVRYPGAVISPGWIDLLALPGAFDNNVETAQAIDSGVSAIHSVDFEHRHFARALASGITTVMITPKPVNIVCGAAAVIKTGGASRTGRILRDDGPLIFALGSTTHMYLRAPTSRIGALSMLREELRRARKNRSHPRLNAFVAGKLDAVVYCETPMDVDAAFREFADIASRVSVIHTSDQHDLGDLFTADNRAIIVGPFGAAMPQRTLASAGVFQALGAHVALAGAMPLHPADALRMTASLAVRYGMNPDQARRAVTSVPAELAGVAGRVGSILPGLDADLVVFSDDPLRLSARILAVYIDGIIVYRVEPTVSSK